MNPVDFHGLAHEARARPDGTPFDDLGKSFQDLVSIGWIADHKQVLDFVRGKVPLDCLDRLRDDLGCSQPFPGGTKFYCRVCSLNHPGEEYTSPLGYSTTLIWVPGKGCVYVAPGNLVHLIYDHDYQPPQEFVRAVWKSPRVGSLAFAHAIEPTIDPAVYAEVLAAWETRRRTQDGTQTCVCRYCDSSLGAHAQQCFCCGLDWHHAERILLRGQVVTREGILALFA